MILLKKTQFNCIECVITSKTQVQNVKLTFNIFKYCFRLEHFYHHGLLWSKFLHILATSTYLQTEI